jgi:hypothetical protein
MTSSPLTLDMPAPTAGELKASRIAAGLSQVQAAELMGYPVQQGSRGGLQSRTWQALESETDERTMQGPVFAMLYKDGAAPHACAGPKPSPPHQGLVHATGPGLHLNATFTPTVMLRPISGAAVLMNEVWA